HRADHRDVDFMPSHIGIEVEVDLAIEPNTPFAFEANGIPQDVELLELHLFASQAKLCVDAVKGGCVGGSVAKNLEHADHNRQFPHCGVANLHVSSSRKA